VLAELQFATVRAQPAVPPMPAFSTGAFVAAEGLDVAVRACSTPVVTWSSALRSVPEAKSEARAIVH
jgi:hypothetical protein